MLSRIDGHQSLREVMLTTGLPVERTIAIVTRLRSIGALLLPGETAAPAPASPPARAPMVATPAAGTGTSPALRSLAPNPLPPRTMPRASNPSETVPSPGTGDLGHDLRLSNPNAEELAALSEDVEVSDTNRRRILAIERLLDKSDPHALLGVGPGADAKALKRAYFLLSKEIHPDRYYGKRLGSFADRMSRVFEATSRAYARLTGTDKSRSASSSSASHPTMRPPQSEQQPQTPQEYAAELFNRACQFEVGGDALGAMKLFAAAVRVDPQTRYLRRATSCALAANQPRSAVEYAKKAHSQAPNDVSSARLLAAAFKAAGKLMDAEEVLIMAMALKSENDVLTAELRNDLAEVRRMLANP